GFWVSPPSPPESPLQAMGAARPSTTAPETRTRLSMTRSLAGATSPFQRGAALCAALMVWLCGCSSGRSDFIGTRVLDTCNESYSVCNQIASCFIGDDSYIEGRFPGEGRIIVRLEQPSTVTVSFFFDNITAVGTLTSIVWNETGCTANTRVDVPGQTVAAEANQTGVFERSENLLENDEHLIFFKSDLEATYLMKVDVIPTIL